MKVCLRLSNDLLSALFLMFFDTITGNYTIYPKDTLIDKYNSDSIIKSLLNEGLNAIVTPTIKPMALKILHEHKISVLRTHSNSLKENIYMLEHMILTEYTTSEIYENPSCTSNCNKCSSQSCK